MEFEDYERLISIYQKPKNKGRIENANVKITKINDQCGDEITIYLLVENDVIKEASFEGNGCLISTVSASLLLDYLRGKKVKEIKNIEKDLIFSLINIDLSKNPIRIKCATLALNALKDHFK
jgi:nitrogen fixation NifU-like protein